MFHDNEIFSQFEGVMYLYLRGLFEPKDNSLVLIAEEAIANESGGLEADATVSAIIKETWILKGARLIESTENCRVFKLF